MNKITDDEFEIKFCNCEIDPKDFDHTAHVRLAWHCIRKYGMNRAVSIVPDYIQNYVTSVGASNKYHATLTIAAVNTIYHFINKSKSSTFEEFTQEFPRVFHSFPQLISYHYSREAYHSVKAQREYIAPDILSYDTF